MSPHSLELLVGYDEQSGAFQARPGANVDTQVLQQTFAGMHDSGELSSVTSPDGQSVTFQLGTLGQDPRVANAPDGETASQVVRGLLAERYSQVLGTVQG